MPFATATDRCCALRFVLCSRGRALTDAGSAARPSNPRAVAAGDEDKPGDKAATSAGADGGGATSAREQELEAEVKALKAQLAEAEAPGLQPMEAPNGKATAAVPGPLDGAQAHAPAGV